MFQKESFSHSIIQLSDTSSNNNNKSWQISIYFTPTLSFNLGKNVPPDLGLQPGIIGFTATPKYEHYGFGWATGFELTKYREKQKVFLSYGLSFERYLYSGTASYKSYRPSGMGSYIYSTSDVSYSYREDFFCSSLIMHVRLLTRPHHKIYLSSGFSPAKLNKETVRNDIRASLKTQYKCKHKNHTI